MRIVFIVLLLIVLTVSPSAIRAQDPTATPTNTPTPYPTFTPTASLAPIQPTATSKYEGLRPTPSPIVIIPNYGMATAVAGMQIRDKTGTFADSIINTYKVLNFYGIADFLSFAGMMIITIVFLVRVFQKLNQHHD